MPKNPPAPSKIPREKYQRFKPGKQEIKVGRKGGFYFTAPDFDWLMWRDIALDKHRHFLEKTIEEYNQSIDSFWKKYQNKMH